jgi:signal transduction histidine kinase
VLKGKVFDRLMRGRTGARGHGLGLYLVRTLVAGFRGRVWVEDRIEGDYTKGCRFVVLLPAAPDDRNNLP